MTCRSANREKSLLLWTTALAILILGGIALVALNKADSVNSESATLVGVVVAGLAAFTKDAVQTVRASWVDERMGKMTDQIAASAPAGDPQPVKVINDPAEPVPVETAQ